MRGARQLMVMGSVMAGDVMGFGLSGVRVVCGLLLRLGALLGFCGGGGGLLFDPPSFLHLD